MPVVAALLARGWRRVWCLAVIPLALLGWYQHLRTRPAMGAVGFSASFLSASPLAELWHALAERAQWAMWTFVWPVAQDNLFTQRAAAVHPVFLLVLAGLGVVVGMRRGLFLLAGFAAGVLPGIVSAVVQVSTHRTMMAFPFIALAAACALNVVPWRGLRAAAVASVLLITTVWSIAFYFSPQFWGSGALHFNFDVERTTISEIVVANPPKRLIAMHQIGDYAPRYDPASGSVNLLNIDNWLPPDGEPVTYLFTWEGLPMRAQYERVFPNRVEPVGRGFLVRLEAADWSWLRRYGWTYEVRCGPTVRTAQVPFVYTVSLGADNFFCTRPMTHVWRAHWNGATTELVFEFDGHAQIEAGSLMIEQEGFETRAIFPMPADSDISITVDAQPPLGWIRARLLESSPGGRRVPDWERFTPIWHAESPARGLVLSSR